MAAGAIRRTLTRLSRNPYLLAVFTIAWLAALYLISFQWSARVLLKILATIPLLFASPYLGDTIEVWKDWKRRRKSAADP